MLVCCFAFIQAFSNFLNTWVNSVKLSCVWNIRECYRSAWLYQSIPHQRFAIYALQMDSASMLPNRNRSWLLLCSTQNYLALTCLFSHRNKYHAIRVIIFNSRMTCHELDLQTWKRHKTELPTGGLPGCLGTSSTGIQRISKKVCHEVDSSMC